MTGMSILDFWNNRAKLKSQAGSDDTIAKTIEMEELARHFHDGMAIAEFGCGNGITALDMARRYAVNVDAFDFAPEMIAEAKLLARTVSFAHRVNFIVSDVRERPPLGKRYDAVFTERMIINLPDWPGQLEAIQTLATYVKVGGKLLLMENSATGLAEINKLRESIGLKSIVSPWHNLYLDDDKVAAAEIPGCKLIEVIPYSATYYFLSRVVNAWLAAQEGKDPSYDAPVNQLARQLPPIGHYAQGKLWIWQRGG